MNLPNLNAVAYPTAPFGVRWQAERDTALDRVSSPRQSKAPSPATLLPAHSICRYRSGFRTANKSNGNYSEERQ